MELKKGQKVVVMDQGLLMLQQYAPEGARPNNVGWVDRVDGDTVYVIFLIGDDDPNEHSQLAWYPKHKVIPKEW